MNSSSDILSKSTDVDPVDLDCFEGGVEERCGLATGFSDTCGFLAPVATGRFWSWPEFNGAIESTPA